MDHCWADSSLPTFWHEDLQCLRTTTNHDEPRSRYEPHLQAVPIKLYMMDLESPYDDYPYPHAVHFCRSFVIHFIIGNFCCVDSLWRFLYFRYCFLFWVTFGIAWSELEGTCAWTRIFLSISDQPLGIADDLIREGNLLQKWCFLHIGTQKKGGKPSFRT